MNSSLQSIATPVHRQVNNLPPDSIIFGRTAHMQALHARVQRAAASDMPILLEGESGTGKDIIARILHRQSPWATGVFVKARCSSIPDSFDALLESSSDVITTEPQPAHQCLENSSYGTLFLDEISESSTVLQTKLLRLLQEGQLCRINLKRCKLNLRLVCATNRTLEEATERGAFRRDLLYRINVVTMRVPPLRERIADVPELAKYFIDFLSKDQCEVQHPSRRLLQSLLSYSWPGNIRELENLMKRYVLFNCEEWVCEELVGGPRAAIAQELSQPGAISLKEITKRAVRDLEREAILKVLQANQWNRKRAACVLNISYRSLLYKLKETGMASAANSTEGSATRRAIGAGLV
jgi:two-component system, NtrC family, response regulator AtoC